MKKKDDELMMSRALRDILLDADPASVTDTIQLLGIDPVQLAAMGRAAAESALLLTSDSSDSPQSGTAEPRIAKELHDGLSVLIRLLRRRDNLSDDDLAARARVEVWEIRRIECDPTYTPAPRTVYQLEQVFGMPSRTLVKLSGLTRTESQEFKDEVLRFAASSKGIQKLTRNERKSLEQFVRFLSSHTDSSEQE